MDKKVSEKKKRFHLILFLSVLIFFVHSLSLFSLNKKVKVVADNAVVYMKPDLRSKAIDTLSKGTILNISSSAKFRHTFYYVYFKPNGSAQTKSGYIHESEVQRLFNNTRATTLRGKKNAYKTSKPAETFWGMSQEAFLQVKGEPSRSEKLNGLEVLGYKQKILDSTCFVGYIFSGQKLSGAKYIFMEDYPNDKRYLVEYKKIKDVLTQTCGLPRRDDVIWNNALYRNDNSNWGLALRLGHVNYCAKWFTPETEIILSLFMADEEITLEVEYSGIKSKGF
jgi:hypothetical protein